MKLMEKKHFKEVDPIETIERLKKILNQYGIELEEKWAETSLADTYSLRLDVKGTDIASVSRWIYQERIYSVYS